MNKIDVNIIYTFCIHGVKILYIDGRYYKVEYWEAGTSAMLKHKMIGVDITETLSSSSQFANQHADPTAVGSAIMKWNDYKKRTIEFHSAIPYTFYQ